VAGKFIVFVPLHEEMEYAHAYMQSEGAECSMPYSQSTDSYFFRFKLQNRTDSEVLFTVIGDMGNTYTLGRITPIIALQQPNACFLVGVAGSLGAERAKLGDVVVSSRAKAMFADKIKTVDPSKEEVRRRPDFDLLNANGVIFIDERKMFRDRDSGEKDFLRFRRMFARSEMSEIMVARYANYVRGATLELAGVSREQFAGLPENLQNAAPAVREGTMFGSDMVIDSESYVRFILERDTDEAADYYNQKAGGRDQRQRWFASTPLAVDMESFGFLTMAMLSKEDFARHYVTVRGISDMAAGKEDLDRTTGQGIRQIAVRNAVKVAIDMINYIVRTNLG
jgi:nucleoside phosphorylase